MSAFSRSHAVKNAVMAAMTMRADTLDVKHACCVRISIVCMLVCMSECMHVRVYVPVCVYVCMVVRMYGCMCGAPQWQYVLDFIVFLSSIVLDVFSFV